MPRLPWMSALALLAVLLLPPTPAAAAPKKAAKAAPAPKSPAPKAAVLLSAPEPVATLLEKQLAAKCTVTRAGDGPADPSTQAVVRLAGPAGAAALVTAKVEAGKWVLQVFNGANGATLGTASFKAPGKRTKLSALPKPAVAKVLAAVGKAKAAEQAAAPADAAAAPKPSDARADAGTAAAPSAAAQPAKAADAKATSPAAAATPAKGAPPAGEPAGARDPSSSAVLVPPALATPAAAEAPAPAAAEASPSPAEAPATEPEAPAPPPGSKPRALRAALGLRLFGRTLDYTEDTALALSRYRLPFGPALGVEAEVYPAVFFTSGIATWFGLGAAVDFLVGVTSVAPDGARYGTSAVRFKVHLLGRYPFANGSEVGLSFGYALNTFEIAAGADPTLKPNVPDVAYGSLRPAAFGRVKVWGPVFAHLGLGFHAVLGSGQLGSADFFPRAAGGGVDFDAGLSVKPLPFLEVKGVFEYQHYWFTLNAQPGDRYQAATAADGAPGGRITAAFVL